MELKQWMELVNYKITSGSEYLWSCYGANAYALDSDAENYGLTVVFSRDNQKVFEVHVSDYVNNRAYRIINTNYMEKYKNECEKRGVNDFAWDDVKWIDLDVEEDFIEKATAIQKGEDYSTKVMVQFDFSEEEFNMLKKLAEEKNISIDEMIEQILIEEIKRLEEKVT